MPAGLPQAPACSGHPPLLPPPSASRPGNGAGTPPTGIPRSWKTPEAPISEGGDVRVGCPLPPDPPSAIQTMEIALSGGTKQDQRGQAPTTNPAGVAVLGHGQLSQKLCPTLPRPTAQCSPGVHPGLDTWPEAPRADMTLHGTKECRGTSTWPPASSSSWSSAARGPHSLSIPPSSLNAA